MRVTSPSSRKTLSLRHDSFWIRLNQFFPNNIYFAISLKPKTNLIATHLNNRYANVSVDYDRFVFLP